MDFESETFVAGEIAHALKGEGHDGSEDGTGRGVPLVPVLAATLKASDGGVSGKDAPHVVAFSAKDYGADATNDLAPTLRAGGHRKSHANAGVMPAIAFNARQDPDISGTIRGPLDTDPGTQAIAFAENSRAEVRLEGGDGQTTGSLKTGGGKPGQSFPCVASDTRSASRPDATMSVRRLTPTECERLMGVPDGYTRIPDRTFTKRPKGAHFRRHRYLYEKQADGAWLRFAADGPRYKALGNSIAVPCLRHIGINLARALGLEIGKPAP